MSLNTSELVQSMREARASYLDRSRFNFEGVFMNSLYGVGLVGVGWVAVKLGLIIQDVQGSLGAVFDQAEYEVVVYYVEGDGKDLIITDPTRYGLTPELWSMIVDFRVYGDEYAAWKADMLALKDSTPPELKVLKLADAGFARFGPILPLGVVGVNVLTEVIRVRRMKKLVEVDAV